MVATRTANTETSDAEFAAFRADFPAFEKSVYLSVSARGLLSRTTRAAIDGALDAQMLGRVIKENWKAAGESARRNFASICHVRPEEVALTKNVSDGMNSILASLPWERGDNLVCCLEFEHPNVVYALLNLAKRGVEVRSIRMRHDMPDARDMAAAMDARTRLVAISSVNFATGFRVELGQIGEACRSRGVFFLVDGAQSVGILDIDLKACQIDAFAVSANKGLLGVYGQGFLFCDQDWASRLHPAYMSRFGIRADGIPESELGPADYRMHEGARRFDVGNANWPGLIAAAASMGQLLQLGPAAVEKRVLSLAAKLVDGFNALEFPVAGPREPSLRSHIVSIVAADKLSTERLATNLQVAGVVFSRRRNVLRFGIHAYNNDSDLSLVLDTARAARK